MASVEWHGNEVKVSGAPLIAPDLTIDDSKIETRYFMEDLMDTSNLPLDFIFLNPELKQATARTLDLTIRIPIPLIKYNGVSSELYINSSATNRGSTWRLNGWTSGLTLPFTISGTATIAGREWTKWQLHWSEMQTKPSNEITINFKFDNFEALYYTPQSVDSNEWPAAYGSRLELSFSQNFNPSTTPLYTMQWNEKGLYIPRLSTSALVLDNKNIEIPANPCLKYYTDSDIDNVYYGLRRLLENAKYTLGSDTNILLRVPFKFPSSIRCAFYLDYELIYNETTQSEEDSKLIFVKNGTEIVLDTSFKFGGPYLVQVEDRNTDALYIQIPNDAESSENIKFKLSFALIREFWN